MQTGVGPGRIVCLSEMHSTLPLIEANSTRLKATGYCFDSGDRMANVRTGCREEFDKFLDIFTKILNGAFRSHYASTQTRLKIFASSINFNSRRS